MPPMASIFCLASQQLCPGSHPSLCSSGTLSRVAPAFLPLLPGLWPLLIHRGRLALPGVPCGNPLCSLVTGTPASARCCHSA